MTRVLVTGAAGFVGRHVLRSLAATAACGDQIVGIGRGLPHALPDGVSYRQVDLLNETAIRAFVAEYRPTVVLHLAGIASVQQSADGPHLTWRINLVGLMNLAVAVAQTHSKARFYYVSSGEVYGRACLGGHAVNEAARPEPQNTYARSKLCGEAIVSDIFSGSDVQLTVLRPFNHIGVWQDERFVVASFAGQIARIEAGLTPPVIFAGNLSVERDFLPVSDVVRAYVALIGYGDAIPNGAVFNIASGYPRSIASILETLRRHSRATFSVEVVQKLMRASDIPVVAGDASRLTSAIGWTPREDWDAALVSVLEYARAVVNPMVK